MVWRRSKMGTKPMDAIETEQLGRREKNKKANRKAILNAGLEVFSTIGYESATITDIVKASGLSVGTFYNYYGDKDSVFAELVDGLVVTSQHAFSKARENANSVESFVSDAYQAYAQILFENPDMQRLIAKNTDAFRQFVFGSIKMGRLLREMEDDMKKGIEAGLLPPYPVRLMVAAMIGAGAEVFAIEDDEAAQTPAEKAKFLTDIFVAGIKGLNKTGE